MNIVINTPAGNIGRVVANRLLLAGNDVTMISRNPTKVQYLIRQGASLIQGSLDDTSVVDRALEGADALFWLTPFAFDQPDYLNWARQIGRVAANSVKRHSVKRVVLVSSIGAHQESGVGPIGCLPTIENSFKEVAPEVTSLRAGSFMENFMNDVHSIAVTGTIFGPRPAAKKIPWVATRDIGTKAAEALLDSHSSGFRIVGVHGPEDIAPSRAAEIIGEGIGRPVVYVEVTVEQAKKTMGEAGLPGYVVDLLGEMYTGFREGRMVSAEPRTSETTTETSLLDFSREVLKPAVMRALKQDSIR